MNYNRTHKQTPKQTNKQTPKQQNLDYNFMYDKLGNPALPGVFPIIVIQLNLEYQDKNLPGVLLEAKRSRGS